MLKLVAAILLCLSLIIVSIDGQSRGSFRRGGSVTPPIITSVSFGAVFAYNGTNYLPGDTFGNTWADDGTAYSLANDTSGPNGANYNNVLFGKFSSFDSSMLWTVVNTMANWGTLGQMTGTGGPTPGGTGGPASHKTGGLISVQNNMYTVGWRLDEVNGAVGYDGILLKTIDHSNWTPVPSPSAAPYPASTGAAGTIMWPGYDYPIGWVQYGQNYTCTPGPCPDNAGTYVYAIVRNTAPSTSSVAPRLARVRIDHIANQAIADWSYYQGPQGADGMLDANWGALSSAFVMPFGASSNNPVSIQYLPRYNQYVTILARSPATNDFVWDVFTSFHPWGPWTFLATGPHYNPQAISFPFIAPKSLGNGGQTLTVAASSSNFAGAACNSTTGYYCPYLVPLSFTP